jgi:ribosomal-protein-alanine N-acetyltransferase
LHAAAFEAPWSAASLAQALASSHTFALLASHGDTPVGFILAQTAADEAEILTLAVAPPARRAGVASALVKTAATAAGSAGAETLWLEVAEDNAAALALYTATGFEAAGRRRGYYVRPGGAVDALMMRRRLNSGSA